MFRMRKGQVMTKRLTAIVATLSLLVGAIIGSWLTAEGVEAQTRHPRFHVERHGELIFIRYLHRASNDCFIGMDGAGIVSVPCD